MGTVKVGLLGSSNKAHGLVWIGLESWFWDVFVAPWFVEVFFMEWSFLIVVGCGWTPRGYRRGVRERVGVIVGASWRVYSHYPGARKVGAIFPLPRRRVGVYIPGARRVGVIEKQ